MLSDMAGDTCRRDASAAVRAWLPCRQRFAVILLHICMLLSMAAMRPIMPRLRWWRASGGAPATRAGVGVGRQRAACVGVKES